MWQLVTKRLMQSLIEAGGAGRNVSATKTQSAGATTVAGAGGSDLTGFCSLCPLRSHGAGRMRQEDV